MIHGNPKNEIIVIRSLESFSFIVHFHHPFHLNIYLYIYHVKITRVAEATTLLYLT